MNVLVTGKLDSIATHLVADAGNNRIILAAKNIPPSDMPKNVRTFNIGPNDVLFQRVTKVGSFDAAVFFMARGEHADKSEGGVSAFQNMLEHCVASAVSKIILVSSGEVYSGLGETTAVSENTEAIPKGAQGYQIKAAEDICQQYWRRKKEGITVIRLPFIYQRENILEGDGLLSNFFKAIMDGQNKFTLPGSADSHCDFLSDVEAARLIWLIIDEGISSKSVFVNTGTGKSTTMGGIANLFTRHFPEISINYSGDNSDIPPPMRTKIAKSEYGWNALNSLTDDFAGIKESVTVVPVQRFAFFKKFFRAMGQFFRGSKGFIVVEFIAASALLQFLTVNLRRFTFATWLDLRLIFVVILSTLHGTVPGIIAGVIAGAVLFISLGGSNWRMIVYNPETWIPFALYVIIGVALGSRTDRQIDTTTATEERLTMAEQTNIYLIELYDEAVHIKDKYRDQILGYKDNFGRIYSIVKKLNSEMSEYVFSSAIEVMEDVLQNNSVTIYSMTSRGDYARMTVCSKALQGEVQRSMKMADYSQISDKLEKHDIWFNRDLIKGFPSYCAPVYNEEKLIALVVIWRAGVDQMTLHYSNLFTIISGLIQESLVRAVKFHKLRESTSYYPDTRILLKEPFWEAYRANLTLAEQEKAGFCLIVVTISKHNMAAQNSQIESCIRDSDIVGAINEKQYCIILKNVSSDDIKTLLSRFASKKVKAKQISVAEMHDIMLKEAGKKNNG